MASKPKEPPRIPADAELVACLDGPMVNQWFYLPEWQERREAELRMNRTPATGAALGYVPVRGETIPHPTHPTAVAHALAYAPDVAAAAMERKTA